MDVTLLIVFNSINVLEKETKNVRHPSFKMLNAAGSSLERKILTNGNNRLFLVFWGEGLQEQKLM